MRDTPQRKILILVWPEVSAYHATLRLSRVLTERGDQVVYAVPARWQDFIKRQGFETMLVEDVEGRSLWQNQAGWLKSLLTSQETAWQQLEALNASLVWIKSGGFTLVLLYVTLWHFALALHHLGIPYVAVNACLGGPENVEIPPIFSSQNPGPGRALQNRLAWLRLRFLGAFNHRHWGILPSNPLARQARLQDIGFAARHFFRTIAEPLRMPVYYRLLHTARENGARIGWGDYGYRLVEPELVLGPRSIDYPWVKQTPYRLYAGACMDTQRVEDAFDWSRVDEHRPVVYCAIGSHGSYWNQANRLRLVKAAIVACQAHPEWQLLLQLPGHDDLTTLGALPGNVMTAAWFPQIQALERADLVISHGGFGTLREALFYGVPLVVFPLGVDQPGNAARVVYHRVGLAGDIRTVTAEGLRKMIETVMRDPSFRKHASQMSQYLQADNDCAGAVAFLDAFIGRHPRQQPVD